MLRKLETYGYNADDNLTSETNSGNGRIGPHTYTYDKAERIASWTTSTGTTAYTYDGAGNRLTAGAASYTYDARNRMLTGPASSYVWKSRGSPVSQTVSGVTTTYTTDAAERITSTAKTGYTATNVYDVLDRVVSRTAAGVTTLPRYAGFGLEPTAILPSTGVGFVSQFARSVNGQLLAEKTSGVSAVVALDRHGDAVMWYPTTGVPITAYKVYDPFGAVTSSGGTQSALGFQGQFTDATTGDVNMGARWYNPWGGSFRGRDTVFGSLGSLGSPASLNRYAYASGNPLNMVDPNGRFSVDLSTLSGFTGGDAFAGLTETLGAGISDPVIVSYETANPSAGVYNYVANFSDGSSTIATIAPTGVNVSQPNTTVSSGYLAYTPNDATAAAAIQLIQSGTPSPAIGQAINDAYNAISAAPTQEAILATAATNAAALAAQTAANTPDIEPAPTTPQTQTPAGPSEAPGDPDIPDELAIVTFGGCVGGGQNEYMNESGVPNPGGSQCPPATTTKSPEILLPDGTFQPVGTCLSGSVAFFYGVGLGGCRVGMNQANGYWYGTTASLGVGLGLEVSGGGSVLYTNVDSLRSLGGWSTCLSLSLAAVSGEYCWWSGGRSFAGSVSTGANLSTLISESLLATKGVGFHIYRTYTWTSLTQQLQAAPGVCWYNCTKKGYV